MRDQGFDPFPLPNYTWTKFDFDQGELVGLSSLHRTGPVAVEFEENIVRITINVGAENLKGNSSHKFIFIMNSMQEG